MYQIKRIDLRKYAQPNSRLFRTLGTLKSGQPLVYRTPFWNEKPMPVIVKAWMEHVLKSNLDSKMIGLLEVELEQSKKVGPYSVIPPSYKRMKHLLEYWEPVKNDAPVSKFAISQVKKMFRRPLAPCTVEEAVAEMRLNTSAGLPYDEKRRDALEIYRRINWEQDYPYMAIWGARVQPGGPSVEDEKVRDVFMMPFHLNVMEGRYYYPLLKYEQEEDLPFAIHDLRWTEEKITKLFETKGSTDLVINTDFSSFDQTYREPMQRASFEILNSAFVGNEMGDELFYTKYRLPMLISDDTAIFGDHGMGSGSTGTNPDENLGHKALQFEAAEEAGQELNPYSLTLGDDGILTFKGITVDAVVKSYTKHGLMMNEAKQYVSRESAKYLQRYYHVSYRDSEGIMLGVYPTFRALGRLLAQERFHDPKYWGPKQVTLRALSILENCRNHPLFEEFIEFVMKGDKYHLGRKIPGFFETLEAQWAEYKEHHELESYTQRNEKTSILDWKVVKYLMLR